MNVIVFEDSLVEKLHPVTTGRPAYAIHCAGFRLVDWLNLLDGNLIGLVRTYLETIQLHDFPGFATKLDAEKQWTLVVNARMAPSRSNFQNLQRLMDTTDNAPPAETTLTQTASGTAAAIVPTSTLLQNGDTKWSTIIDGLPEQAGVKKLDINFQLFEYPHDIIATNMNCFAENAEQLIANHSFTKLREGVYIGENVSLHASVAFDASKGPIIINDNCQIGPFAFFRGPVYLASNCKVSEHASLKDAVSVANTCKIGGEVEGTVFESYSNKQHHGFLGHSYIGSWINLGAGTCNSDLKNTYGIVNVKYGNQKVSSGSQFVGCIMGDYAKTAINTSIFTGKVIGTASMVYGFATTNVPSFTNYARTFNSFGILPPEVIVTTQKRMFARRNVPQRPCDIQLVHDMFRLTHDERPEGLSREPISL